MVPFRAASRENGVPVLERPKEGGSTREYAPVRRRDERMPVFLPRVGDRPAGADRGDFVMPVFNLVGDLGLRCDRDRGVAALGGLATAMLLALIDLVRKNDGLARGSLVELLLLSEPFDLLEKSCGSTFSESSVSKLSAAFRFPGEFERAMRKLFSTAFQTQLYKNCRVRRV